MFLVFYCPVYADFCCILVYALGNTLYCTRSLLAVQLGDLGQGEKGLKRVGHWGAGGGYHIYIYIYVYAYMYTHVCVRACVRVCLCARGRV